MPFTESVDGTRLYYEINHASTPQIDALLIHGFGEHCRRYDHFCEHLNDLGVSVLRFDLRGHGRSEGRRGHILAFSEYLDDVRAALKVFNESFSASRRLLIGHSNGGLIATHVAADIEEIQGWDGLILSSPFFGIKVKVPAWKSFLGAKLSRLIPSLQLPTELPPEVMSHDPELIESYGSDPLISRVASARWFTETLDAHAEVVAKLQAITHLSSLWQIAGSDHVADSEVSISRFDELATPHKTLKVYPECYHELWFEEDALRAPVLSDLDRYLKELVSPPPPSSEGETE